MANAYMDTSHGTRMTAATPESIVEQLGNLHNAASGIHMAFWGGAVWLQKLVCRGTKGGCVPTVSSKIPPRCAGRLQREGGPGSQRRADQSRESHDVQRCREPSRESHDVQRCQRPSRKSHRVQQCQRPSCKSHRVQQCQNQSRESHRFDCPAVPKLTARRWQCGDKVLVTPARCECAEHSGAYLFWRAVHSSQPSRRTSL